MYALICLINWTAINKADTKYNRLLLQGANRVYTVVFIRIYKLERIGFICEFFLGLGTF